MRGDKIFTSSPYALCHQLSNGADAIIAKEPQMATQAPRGPRNPQKCTVPARSSSLPAKVVRRTSQPQAHPARTPPK